MNLVSATSGQTITGWTGLQNVGQIMMNALKYGGSKLGMGTAPISLLSGTTFITPRLDANQELVRQIETKLNSLLGTGKSYLASPDSGGAQEIVAKVVGKGG